MPLNVLDLPGLQVRIDEVLFSPDLDSLPDRPFPFVYRITISNGSNVPVTIRCRKWVVTERCGRKIVVEGDGVVGQTPRLQPGEMFSYSSYHVVASDSEAEGCYLGVLDDGTVIRTRIPRFALKIP
jgi:ApaG protein